MLLSSYERARRHLCVEDTAANRRIINQYLYGVSASIESYLDRQFEKISRTEYFNLSEGDREFFVSAPGITTLTTVKIDSTGEFTGSETELTDSFIGRSGNSVVLQFGQIPSKRGLQIVYTGGIATTTSISTYTLTTVVGSFSVGEFVEGMNSGALGIITAFNTVSEVMSVDVLYGTFLVAETLRKRDTEEAGFSNGITAVLSTIDVQSLVELEPEIALAVETQLRYNVKTKDDFENKTVTKDMVSRRDNNVLALGGNGNAYFDLQPETRSLLAKHRRHVFY